MISSSSNHLPTHQHREYSFILQNDVEIRHPADMLLISHICISRKEPKPEAEIQSEIRAILKQIISMVTYLPVIQEPTVFNILAYTNESADVPAGEWVDTDPLAIEASKSQQVKMRSFSTDVHRIEAMVAYRYEE